MSSHTSQSYKNRIERFRSFIEIVSQIEGYAPRGKNQSVDGMKQVAKRLETIHEATKTIEEETSAIISKRRLLYLDKKEGLMKRLTPINMYVKGEEGLSEQLLKRLQTIFNRMRGRKRKQTSDSPKPQLDANQALDPLYADLDAEQRKIIRRKYYNCTYGGRYDDLKLIITLLARLGPIYTPSNKLITRDALIKFHKLIGDTNREVDRMKTKRRKKKTKRRNDFKNMKKTVQHVKWKIGSQFGTDSEQYDMVKDFKI